MPAKPKKKKGHDRGDKGGYPEEGDGKAALDAPDAPAASSRKAGGYDAGEAPPVAPAAAAPAAEPEKPTPAKKEATPVKKADAKEGIASESEDDEEDDGSEGGGGDDAAPDEGGKRKGEPRFASVAEQKAHEDFLKKLALEDKATIRRLQEIREKREQQKEERDAVEQTAADEDKQKKKAAKAADEKRQAALSSRPKLELPGPKEIKDGCVRLQNCASDEFQQKHGLKGAGGNKLAKMKMGDFKKIFDDFQENAPIEHLHAYLGT